MLFTPMGVGDAATRESVETLARRWWIPLLAGMLTVAAGVVILAVDWTAKGLAWIVGAIFIYRGLTRALTPSFSSSARRFNAVTAIASVLAGVAFVVWPEPSLLVLSAVMLVALLVAESRAAEPIIPLVLFSHPVIGLCSAAAFILGVGMFGTAVAEGEVQVTGDYPADPSFVHFPDADRLVRDLAIRSFLVAPLISQLLTLAVSRRREYLADAMSAQFTRNPLALASALEKIEAAAAPTAAIKRGAAHLCIVDPLGHRLTNSEGWLADRFATHPPMSMRISRLKGMGYAQLKKEGGSFTSSALNKAGNLNGFI